MQDESSLVIMKGRKEDPFKNVKSKLNTWQKIEKKTENYKE